MHIMAINMTVFQISICVLAVLFPFSLPIKCWNVNIAPNGNYFSSSTKPLPPQLTH